MLLSLIPMTVNAATTDYLTYSVSGREVIITGYSTYASGKLVIPDTIEGYPVTTISDRAFYNCCNLTNVTIPDSVTSIGSGAFGITSLTSVTIPDSVTSIDTSAFSGCTSLTEINVSSGNENYRSVDGILYNKAMSVLIFCPADLTTFTIPDSVTQFASYAFDCCTNLTDIYYSGTMEDWNYIDQWFGCGNIPAYTQIHCSDGIINKHEHTIVTDSAVPATCTTDGKTEGSHCSVCNAVIKAQETIPATGHTYKDTVTAPTETERGYTTHTCTVCGDSYRDTYTDPIPSSSEEPAPSESVTPSEDPTPFTFADDDSSGAWTWASDYIYSAYNKGIFKGDSEGNFNPSKNLTRAEAVTALLAMMGVEADMDASVSGFTDADGAWYTPYVAAAKENGLSAGYANGDGSYSFKPKATITRAEFITMVLAAKGISADVVTGSFSDVKDSDWYAKFVYTAAANELVTGYANADGSYSAKPTANITRAEAAVILSK